MLFTIRNGVDFSPSRDKVCAKDTDVDAHATHSSPPSDQITDEVNLLLAIVLRPEADTTEKERPIDGSASVRVGSSQSGVML